MKSYLSHFTKGRVFLLSIALALLLFALAGCSSGSGQEGTAEIERLTAENEKLSAELEEMNAKLEAAEARVQELEDKLETKQEEKQPASSPSEPVSADITPPKRTPDELLLGQWFYQGFNEDGAWSWTQSILFRPNGSVGQE